jgi:hypothetical protein
VARVKAGEVAGAISPEVPVPDSLREIASTITEMRRRVPVGGRARTE